MTSTAAFRPALRHGRRQAAHPLGDEKIWGNGLTTVFPRQGHYAFDPEVVRTYPAADVTVEAIGELARFERSAFELRQGEGRGTRVEGTTKH